MGSKAPPFVGFNVLKPVMTNFSDEVDPEINQDFQLVLKKMNKKDATTKLKVCNISISAVLIIKRNRRFI